MKEKYKDRMFIDMGEFQRKILEHVSSEEFNKQFESTQFSTYEDAKRYKQAMMHGMIMAGLMTSQCVHFYVREKLETENDETEPIEKCSGNNMNKLTLQDLQQLENKFIWWDNFGGMQCQCKKGYVVTEAGTFSFDFVLSNGSAYLHKPDAMEQ